MRPLLALVSAPLLAALPRAAEACAVCLSGREDDTGRAFLAGTLLLSALPLGLVGGLALFVRRRAREAADERARAARGAA